MDESGINKRRVTTGWFSVMHWRSHPLETGEFAGPTGVSINTPPGVTAPPGETVPTPSSRVLSLGQVGRAAGERVAYLPPPGGTGIETGVYWR